MLLLKQALEDGDWTKVARVYTILTGEVVTNIPTEQKTPIVENPVKVQPKVKKKRGRPKGSKNKVTKTSSKIEHIEDDIEDEDDLRDLDVTEEKNGERKTQFITSDVVTDQDKSDKALYENQQRVPRRKPFKGVTIDCDSCSKEFTNVSPVHIKVAADTKKGKFTCNECQARGKV